MASDTGDSRRKHRRLSDDEETEKSSKRHKHRHHHRHHRHRHSSKKRDEESKIDAEEAAPPSIHQPSVVQNGSRPDDDVEEGEIRDEEGTGGCDLESDLGSRKQILGECDEDDSTVGEVDHKFTLPVEERIKRCHSSLKTLKEDWIDNDLTTNLTSRKEDKANGKHNFANKIHGEVGLRRHPSSEHEDGSISGGSPHDHINGDIGHKSYKIENSQKLESDSSSRGSGRGKKYSDVDHVEADDSKLLISLGEKHKASSYRDRYHEVNAVPRSRSQERARERSRSQSVVEEDALQKRRRDTDRDSSYRDTDEGRMSRRNGDRLPASRDLVGDEDREHSTRGRSRETWDKDRSRDYGSDRDHRRDAELERSRDRDHRRERERERSRDRDHRREMERERSRDRVLEKERKWDYERHKSKDREDDRDRRREKERDRKDRDVDRVRDRKWESERDRRNDRIRDRDSEADREKYKDDDRVDRDRHRDSRLSRHDEGEYQRDRTRKSDAAKFHSSKSDSLEEGEEKQKRTEDEKEDYEESVPFLAEQEEEDLNRIKEESRRRMQAILEKYKSKPSQQKTEPQSDEAEKDKVPTEHSSQPIDAGNVGPEISDDKSDGVDTHGADPQFSVGKSPTQNGLSVSETTTGAGGLGEGSPKSERSTDMFCDDIFGESPAGIRKSAKGDGLHIERSGFHDNWDDADGYYSYRFGEILDGRYEVTAAHGKGVFSTVVRARDLKAGIGDPEEVAIKIIRNNDTMYKAGIEELGILKKLVGSDPDDKRHCVRFLSSFKYRNHLCLVFESLHMNLREVLKKFGRNIGLKLTAVRAYAKQLFIALKHLKNCGVLHCDIKPDNMLVNEAKNVLKLCDFGNAMYAGKNEITPYLVSRFYRAPEIILGLTYDHPLDIWSVGCCLFELYTGKVLFPGHTNNDMLRLHMELKGPFPKKMLRKGGFIDQHFDQDLNFLAIEDDPVTKKVIRRTLFNIKPKDIGSIISGSSGEDPKMLANFKDLLEKIFMLDPEKRMTVSQALNHPFITGK